MMHMLSLTALLQCTPVLVRPRPAPAPCRASQYAVTRLLQLAMHIALVVAYDLSAFSAFTLFWAIGAGFLLQGIQLYTFVIYRAILKQAIPMPMHTHIMLMHIGTCKQTDMPCPCTAHVQVMPREKRGPAAGCSFAAGSFNLNISDPARLASSTDVSAPSSFSIYEEDTSPTGKRSNA